MLQEKANNKCISFLFTAELDCACAATTSTVLHGSFVGTLIGAVLWTKERAANPTLPMKFSYDYAHVALGFSHWALSAMCHKK